MKSGKIAQIVGPVIDVEFESDSGLPKIYDSLEIENIGLIKIDVEGAELEVLKGALKTISNQKPNLIIENEINRTETPELLFKFMNNIHYDAFYVNGNRKLVKLENNFNIFDNQKDPARKRFGYIQNFIFMHQDRL